LPVLEQRFRLQFVHLEGVVGVGVSLDEVEPVHDLLVKSRATISKPDDVDLSAPKLPDSISDCCSQLAFAFNAAVNREIFHGLWRFRFTRFIVDSSCFDLDVLTFICFDSNLRFFISFWFLGHCQLLYASSVGF
jgi:hypothetical protein